MPSRTLPSIRAFACLSALALSACSNPDIRLNVTRQGSVRPTVVLCESEPCGPGLGEQVDVFQLHPDATSQSVGIDFEADGAKAVNMQWFVPGNFCRNWKVAYGGSSASIEATVSCAGLTLTCSGAVCSDLGDCERCEGCERCQ